MLGALSNGRWALRSAVMACAVATGGMLAAQGVPAATDEPVPDPRPMVVTVAVPPIPADARAAKAYAAFDGFCAQCHQTGRLKIPAAARPLANILALDQLATEPSLVTPGVPDSSELYTIMLRQHATIELDAQPPADAIQAVRDWIAELPKAEPTCGGRARVTVGDVEAAVTATLAAAGDEKRKDLRFITLTHLWNACAPPETLDGFRQALSKVVNTLSWGPEPIRLDTVDPAGTIVKLDLSELGWVAAHWDKLIETYAYSTLASARLSDNVRRMAATPVPVVRGDWLAHADLEHRHRSQRQSWQGTARRHHGIQCHTGWPRDRTSSNTKWQLMAGLRLRQDRRSTECHNPPPGSICQHDRQGAI
jgi:hypothetical protein